MNCEYVYTKNINRHLIHIVDKIIDDGGGGVMATIL